MTIDTKQQIVLKLQEYCESKGSQNKAANSLNGVSSATISLMINNKWELINDDMWRNVASQIGFNSKEWNYVRTGDFVLITDLLNDAKTNSNVFAIIGEAGSGKSKALELYTKDNRSTYLLKCSEFWNRKEFLLQLSATMGVDYGGFTVAEMMNDIIKKLKSQNEPCIIIDEADKLTDQVLYFFISLYNQLEDSCGIVMCATDHLSKRITKGLKLNKKGYKEIYSRIGRKFITLRGVSPTDITSICIANGVDDKKMIADIIGDAEYDLRRVKRKIHALKNKK